VIIMALMRPVSVLPAIHVFRSGTLALIWWLATRDPTGSTWCEKVSSAYPVAEPARFATVARELWQ